MNTRCLLPLAAACLLSDCAQQAVPGIEPAPATSFFGRRHQAFLPSEQADMAVVFVGGFSEQVLTHFRSTYETMPLLPCGGRQLRAFYAWDGGTGNLFFHSTWRLQRDLRAFMQRNPHADIVLLGHSYGGSAVMDALRHLDDVKEHGRIIVVTLDPVSRRGRSEPRTRAPQVDVWINAYCDPYRAADDVVPLIGGTWRNCPQADSNIAYPGTARSEDGERFQHRFPKPLLMEDSPLHHKSAYKELCERCRELRTGYPPQSPIGKGK